VIVRGSCRSRLYGTTQGCSRLFPGTSCRHLSRTLDHDAESLPEQALPLDSGKLVAPGVRAPRRLVADILPRLVLRAAVPQLCAAWPAGKPLLLALALAGCELSGVRLDRPAASGMPWPAPADSAPAHVPAAICPCCLAGVSRRVTEPDVRVQVLLFRSRQGPSGWRCARDSSVPAASGP
jgi:hypothetical protein